MAYLGIDMGTSGCKAAVVEEDGRIRVSLRGEYPILNPGPGLFELDPRAVYDQVERILTDLSPYCGDVTAAAVSSIGEAMVMLDENEEPLANGILYLDRRCEPLVQEVLREMPAEEIYAITGRNPSPMFSLLKILWFRQNRPEIISRTKKFFLFGDYIAWRLCGGRGIDPGTASTTLLCDVRSYAYSKAITERFGVDPALFSPVRKPGEELGTILRSVAERTGLPADLRVLTGMHDQGAATLGGGGLADGDVVSGQGSSESYNLVVDESLPLLTAAHRNHEPYLEKGKYFAINGNKAHGTSIRWFAEKIEKDLYEKAGSGIYDLLNEKCAPDCDSLLFLPAVANAAGEKGWGGFVGIDPGTTKEKMYRALLEGLCFEARRLLRGYTELGLPVRSLHMVGGAARSDLLMQMKADVHARPVSVLENTEAGITALAMIADASEHGAKDYREVCSRYLRVRKTFYPERDYSEKAALYDRLYRTLGNM